MLWLFISEILHTQNALWTTWQLFSKYRSSHSVWGQVQREGRFERNIFTFTHFTFQRKNPKPLLQQPGARVGVKQGEQSSCCVNLKFWCCRASGMIQDISTYMWISITIWSVLTFSAHIFIHYRSADIAYLFIWRYGKTEKGSDNIQISLHVWEDTKITADKLMWVIHTKYILPAVHISPFLHGYCGDVLHLTH